MLDISKNSDLTDYGSLKVLAEAFTVNKTLNVIDVTGIIVNKAFCVDILEPALRRNISLKKIIGKFPQKIVDEELKINNLITTYIEPCFSTKFEHKRHYFDMRQVE